MPDQRVNPASVLASSMGLETLKPWPPHFAEGELAGVDRPNWLVPRQREELAAMKSPTILTIAIAFEETTSVRSFKTISIWLQGRRNSNTRKTANLEQFFGREPRRLPSP